MTGELIVTLIIGIASPIATMISALMTMRKESKKIDEKQNEVIMINLRTQIQGIYAIYKDKQEMPLSVYSSLCSLYDKYENMGGNSYIKELKNEMDHFKKL